MPQTPLPLPANLTCWVVTDGKAGMENQCLGLAEALGLNPIVKRIKLRKPWKQLTPFLRHGLGMAFSRKGDPIAPPWPDLLIATGRASVPASLYVRRMSAKNGGKPCITIQIQNPVIAPSRFDLVVVPRHDSLTGKNVMTTRGSLHRVTPELLKREAEKFLPKVADQLADLAGREGSLMITPSRRTGQENLEILKDSLRNSPVYLWDETGDNPYYGMLGLADAVVVTCDSVNMVSEACSTGKPVMVIDLPGGSDKFRRFHQALRDDGMIRPFNGHIESWKYPPLEDMRLVADRIREIFGGRGK